MLITPRSWGWWILRGWVLIASTSLASNRLYLAYVSPLSAREMKTNEMKCYFAPSPKCVCMRLLSDAREMRVGQQLMSSLDLNMIICSSSVSVCVGDASLLSAYICATFKQSCWGQWNRSVEAHQSFSALLMWFYFRQTSFHISGSAAKLTLNRFEWSDPPPQSPGGRSARESKSKSKSKSKRARE